MLEGKPVLIPGDGSSLWTLTDSRDFAVGFVGLLGNIHAIGEAVQITSDESLTRNQIYQIMADALGVPLKPCHVSTDFLGRCAYFDLGSGLIGDKSNSVVFDNSKLKRLVPGFTAVHRYDQSAREISAYVLSHMDQMQPDPEFDQWCDWVIEAQEEAIGRVAALAEKIRG